MQSNLLYPIDDESARIETALSAAQAPAGRPFSDLVSRAHQNSSQGVVLVVLTADNSLSCPSGEINATPIILRAIHASSKCVNRGTLRTVWKSQIYANVSGPCYWSSLNSS